MSIPLPICFTEHDTGGVKYAKDTVTRRLSAHAKKKTFRVSIQLDEDHVQVLGGGSEPIETFTYKGNPWIRTVGD
jgi:hypothetical protein